MSSRATKRSKAGAAAPSATAPDTSDTTPMLMSDWRCAAKSKAATQAAAIYQSMVRSRVGRGGSGLVLPEALLSEVLDFGDLAMLSSAASTSVELCAALRRVRCDILTRSLYKRSPRTVRGVPVFVA